MRTTANKFNKLLDEINEKNDVNFEKYFFITTVRIIIINNFRKSIFIFIFFH